MNSDRTTYNPVYGSLLLAIFGFGVLSLLYMAAGSVQLESQDTQDAQMYTTISQNISVPTESETLIPIQEVQEPVCKAGYNPGSELDQNAITTAAGKFGSTVTVITARDFSRTASFISSANDNQLLPIIRLCYKNADPNHCSDFKSPGDTADFIVSLANNLDPDEQFVFIAGPNEPISERWVTQNTAILDSDAVPIDTTPRFLAYFQEVGRYTRQVAIEVNSQLTDQPELRDQISVIGPIWNMDYHGCGNRTEFIASFIEGLGGDLGILDGMGGNTYNVNGIQADQCFDPIYENFINGNVPSDFEFHVTEFGPFGADQKNGLKEAYDALAANPYVSTINFFTPFAEDGSEYERHQLSQSEIDTISQCDISLEDPAPEEEEPIVEDVREVPYAVYYEEAFAPYEMQTCERIDSSDQVSGWHRLVPVGTGGAYEGYQIITAQVESFPQLNHFGAAEPFEPDLSRNSFGNRDFPPTPYDPICAVLSRTVGGGGFVSTHEHAGLVKFYGNNDEVVGEFALEKLGSGIGCLNLLSLLNPLSTEGFEGRDIREVYKGFDFVSLSELEQENSYDAGVNSVEVQISRVASELFIDSLTQFGDTIFKGFESLIGRFTGTFDRPLAENEPYAEYNEVSYCRGTELPEIRYLNTTANEPSESITSKEQVIVKNPLAINLANFCASGDAGRPFTLQGTANFVSDPNLQQTLLCNLTQDGTYILKPFEEIAAFTVWVEADYEEIEMVGIPGATSGLAKLYEVVQQRASSLVHDLVAPLNGTKFTIRIQSYDPYRTDTQDLTFIPDIEDSDVNDEVVLERYEFQGRVPFESADAPPGLSSVKTDERYEFVMPFDISPYMVAYLYHYSYSPTSEEYFVETNDILRNAGFNF